MRKRHKQLAYVSPNTEKEIVTKTTAQEQRSKKKRHVADIQTKTTRVLNCSNDGCHDSGTTKMSPLVGAKSRRRKTRAERNRLRHKAHNKLCKNDTASTASHEKADFIRHLKKAEEVTSYRAIKKSATEKNSFPITQGRLTRQLGLFNKVKKSEKILRAPLVMSESVKEKTELEMKRILDLSSTEVVQSVDSSNIEVSQTDSKKDSQHSQLSQEHRSKIRHATPLSSRSAISLNSNNSACNPCDMDTSDTRTKSPETSANSLPVSPALSDIASNLLEGLKPRQMFPGKHYLYETKEELCKLIRQNVPNSAVACTPLGKTPVASIASLRGSLSSDTVKRNLLDCMPPPPMEGDTAPLQRSGKPAPTFIDCLSTACEAIQAPSISQDILTNAKQFLDCNDKAMVSRLIQGVNRPARSKRNIHACGDHTEMCKSMDYGDACMVHAHMHAFTGNCCSQIQVEHNYPSQMEIDLAEGRCVSGAGPNVVRYVPAASHTVSRSMPMDGCIHNIDNTQKAVVAQYIHPPGYVCQLPGEFYSTRYHPDDIWLQQCPQVDTVNIQHQPQQQPQSLDILDYIDHNLQSHSAPASRQANVSLSKGLEDALYQHPNHRKYPPLLHQVQSPDSDDGCTLWFAALPPLPPKPPVGTPSPPEKLYPRRLC